MKPDLIHAGSDVIAEKVRQQLLVLSDQVSEAVADAVALSIISGAASAFRELSPKHPEIKEQLIVGAIYGPVPYNH